MNNKYDSVICRKLREKLNEIWKKVEPYENRRPLTSDENKINGYIRDIVAASNSLNGYYARVYQNESENNKKIILTFCNIAFDKIKRAFKILNITYEFKLTDFEQIDLDRIQRSDTDSTKQTDQSEKNLDLEESTAQTEQKPGSSKQTDQESESSKQIEQKSDSSKQGEQTEKVSDLQDQIVQIEQSEQKSVTASTISAENSPVEQEPVVATPTSSRNGSVVDLQLSEDSEPENNLLPTNSNENQDKMVQTKQDFMRLAGPILNYKYNGDPSKLDTFLTDIELVESLAEEEQADLCFKFIKSKLEGRALEAMPDKVTKISDITDALKEKVKADSSRVIEGKISSLRLIKGNFSSFAKQAEELAESLRRSLVIEGMSKKKAEEITIQKTVDLCRKTARSDVVKSVISSTAYTTPAEVIAKFITESDVARQEFQQKQSQMKNQNGGNKKFDKNKKGHFKNNFQNNFHQKNDNKGGGNKKPYYNKYNKGNQNQRTETIRLVQGNPHIPSEGGPSGSSAQETVYQLTSH